MIAEKCCKKQILNFFTRCISEFKCGRIFFNLFNVADLINFYGLHIGSLLTFPPLHPNGSEGRGQRTSFVRKHLHYFIELEDLGPFNSVRVSDFYLIATENSIFHSSFMFLSRHTAFTNNYKSIFSNLCFANWSLRTETAEKHTFTLNLLYSTLRWMVILDEHISTENSSQECTTVCTLNVFYLILADLLWRLTQTFNMSQRFYHTRSCL